MAIDPACEICDGEGWVCEGHEELPWREPSPGKPGCVCGPGVPCLCNRVGTPEMPPGTEIIADVNTGKKVN